MSYRIKTENFEGPFDLLLYLVSRQRVDIGSISITEIIDQYLAEIQSMRALDLDVASDFLLVAATLLNIKAETLVASPRENLDEEFAYLEPNVARDMLIERLITYKQYKNAALGIETCYDEVAQRHARPFGPDKDFYRYTPDFLKGVSADYLGGLAASLLGKRETFLLHAKHITAKPIPVEDYVRIIYQRLRNRPRIMFSDLIDASTPKPVLVVNFLALLELYRRNTIHITQATEFGDIEVELVEGAPMPYGEPASKEAQDMAE